MFRVLSRLSLLLVSLSLPAAAAELVADLQPYQAPFHQSVDIPYLLSLGERAIFVASEQSSGQELWASDGTSTGTELLLDLCSGSCSSSLSLLGTIGGTAFFAADVAGDGIIDLQIWRTDGTRQGTSLVTEHGPQACGNAHSAVLGNAVLFSGFDPVRGCELWRTDGTAAGTHPLLPEGIARNPHAPTVAGGRLFFAASTSTTAIGLWRTDGTAAGTVLVRTFSEPVVTLAAAGPDILFLHWGGNSSELWKSDGTAAGTVRISAFDNPHAFDPFHGGRLEAATLGSRLLFRGPDPKGIGQWIWTSSILGSKPGGSKPAPLSGCPGGCPQVLEASSLTPFGGRVLFAGYGPAGSVELWSTDGSGAGTRKVSTLCQENCDLWPQRIVPLLGQAFFLAGSEAGGNFALWRTDGTAAGTVRLATQRRDPIYRDLRAVQVGNRIVFAGRDTILGPELWVSDGTVAGTGPLTVLNDTETSSSYPTEFLALGDGVVFRAQEGLAQYLWSSDGTAAGTVKLAQVDLSQSRGPTSVQAAGLVFFLKIEDQTSQIWRTDGTLAGTLEITPAGIESLGAPVAFGGKAVFSGGISSLWESDGTPAGTRKLLDLPADISIQHLIPLGSEIWIVTTRTSNPGSSYQLYRTDGTAAGTHEVTTAEDGFFLNDPPKLVRLGNHVFFAASGRRMEALWRTDGTPAGTVPVLQLTLESGSPNTTDLAELQGSVYLIAKNGLWKSEAGGMVLLKAFAPLPRLTSPSFARLNGRLFFSAADGEHGVELWRTDGTAAGTVLVSDIAPGKASSSPEDLEVAGGRLFFNAGDEEHGRELWESDGTEEGTRLVQDIAPGALSADPHELTAAGGKLFFAADDLLSGREPWVHLLSNPGCQPASETLCLGGGRFRVEATWRDFQGNEGRGKAVALTAGTGYFWFFDPANVEVILKTLDGQGLNGHHWVFYGALSTVEYTLTVTDTQTGAARRYVNPPGRLGSVGDTRAFGSLGAHSSEPTLGPEAVEHEPIVRTGMATAANCEPTATRLCLQGGRFAVEARWTDFQGNQGVGKAVILTGDTGYFWFFDAANVEVVLKVLDGRPLNGKHWVFYGALSSVEYTITVTDTQTGKTRTYDNPPGRLASVADTSAF